VIAVALRPVSVPVDEDDVDVIAANDPAAVVVPPMTVLSIVPPESAGSENATPTEMLFGIMNPI
jgi:hypothetical protein